MKADVRRLALYQLHLMIKRNINSYLCKKEWKRRTGLNYPLIKSINGIVNYETRR